MKGAGRLLEHLNEDDGGRPRRYWLHERGCNRLQKGLAHTKPEDCDCGWQELLDKLEAEE